MNRIIYIYKYWVGMCYSELFIKLVNLFSFFESENIFLKLI